MQLTILGNNGPYPCPGGACSGYLLSDDKHETNLLIDCGTGVLSNLYRFTLPCRLDGVLLSHLHYDHMSDLLPMQYGLQFAPRETPLPVFAPKTPEVVRKLLEIPAYAVRDPQPITIGDMHITFCRLRHPVESYGIRVVCDGRTFVYTGDTNEVPCLDAFCAGCDLLLADAGLSAGDWHENAPHLSAERCAEHAKALGTRLLLTHFNPKYDPEDLLAEACGVHADTEIAVIGRTYQI